MKIVKNDLFDYKNRYIWQIQDGFKFSLDSILLAEYTKVANNLNVKELILVQTKNSDISMILVKCIKNSKNGIKIKVLDVSKCSTYQHIFER